MAAWVIFCDGDFDQIVELSGHKNQEVRDLSRMGFEVTTKKFPNAAQAEAWVDSRRK